MRAANGERLSTVYCDRLMSEMRLAQGTPMTFRSAKKSSRIFLVLGINMFLVHVYPRDMFHTISCALIDSLP